MRIAWIVALSITLLAGCATYQTPGAGVNVVNLSQAHVSTTASAVLFDVRTGFVYGAAEATAAEQQRATMWSSEGAIDNARLKTEAQSFQKLLGEFDKLWQGIVKAEAAKVSDERA